MVPSCTNFEVGRKIWPECIRTDGNCSFTEISYLWLGGATIGCPTLFFGLVSWGDGISPLRAGTEGSRLAYKRASQHTVATIDLKGLKTSILLLIVEFFLHWTLLEISGSRNLDDIFLFLERVVILIGFDLCLSRMFLNDLRAHYGCAKFSSVSTKISKSVLATITVGFWFLVRTNGRGPSNLGNVNILSSGFQYSHTVCSHSQEKEENLCET